MEHTITQHIRNHLLKNLGYSNKYKLLPDLDSLKKTEWNTEFERLRSNRLVMGAFRYGFLKDIGDRKSNLLTSLYNKLRVYQQTGNAECLVDVCNYSMFLFMFPSHKSAHFNAEDDKYHCPELCKDDQTDAKKESSGRNYYTGKKKQKEDYNKSSESKA